MKIAFLARNDGTDTRQTKILNSLCALGHQVLYIGWDRRPEEPKRLALDPRIGLQIFKRSAGFGDYKASGWGDFLRFMTDALRRFRPVAVHARDEQMALMALPLRGVAYRYLILDIFDSLAARRFHNPALGAAAWLAQKGAHLGADRIIETSDDLRKLLGRQADKAIVVMNTPHDLGDDLAADYPSGPAVQLATGGTLTRLRDGLETLLQAVDRLPPGSVQINASGWMLDDYAREVFARHPAVRYQWFDHADDFRRQAARCDAITYLRGDADNSLYRSLVMPNRIFDAMSIGRPIIVSRALGLATWVEQQGLGYSYTPGDVQGLAAIIRSLIERRAALPAFAARTRTLFKGQYTWPLMEQRLKALYEGLGG